MSNVAELKTRPNLTREHQGFEITFYPEYFAFGVEDKRPGKPSGDTFDVSVWSGRFNSFADAKKRIDDRLAEEEKAARLTWRKVDVLNNEGKVITARGISKATGDMLFTPPGDQHEVYTNLPWAVPLLKRRAELQTELNRINQKLNKIAHRCKLSYGRNNIDTLQRDYDNFLAAIDRTKNMAEPGA